MAQKLNQVFANQARLELLKLVGLDPNADVSVAVIALERKNYPVGIKPKTTVAFSDLSADGVRAFIWMDKDILQLNGVTLWHIEFERDHENVQALVGGKVRKYRMNARETTLEEINQDGCVDQFKALANSALQNSKWHERVN